MGFIDHRNGLVIFSDDQVPLRIGGMGAKIPVKESLVKVRDGREAFNPKLTSDPVIGGWA